MKNLNYNKKYQIKLFSTYKISPKLITYSILFYLLILLFSCSKKQPRNDQKQHSIRIISLAPSLTETIFYLGKGANLVGRTTECNFPKEAKKIETVGSFGQPSLEKVLSLKPDIVVATALADRNIKQTIEEYGIKFLLLPTDNFQNYKDTLKTLGNILNCAKLAKQEIRKFNSELKKFQSENSKKNKIPKVYLEIWNSPYMTIGKNSFINTMIYYAGGENIFKNVNKGYFNFSLESLIELNPDIIIAPSMRKGSEIFIKNRPNWNTIKAIKNQNIYTNLNNDLIFRLGPRTILGIKLLRSIINNKYTLQNEK